MMCNRINLVSRDFYKRVCWNSRLYSTTLQAETKTHPESFFFQKKIQSYLTFLTRVNHEKVFETRKDGSPLRVPQFKFMTNEELEEAQRKIAHKVKRLMQMPPVVRMRSSRVETLSNDPALQGYDQYNFVFTDISFGYSNKNRLIVVRDTNGVLRYATSNERHRMNQVYFPIVGREVHIPKMFLDPYLDDLLNRKEFEFILDRACLQFEPDDPEYHRITKKVYSIVNKSKEFDALRSTRHFGPFVFHLVCENDIFALLIDVIKSGNIEEATTLIHLYHELHPDAKSAGTLAKDDVELLTTYAKLDLPNQSMRNQLMTAIDTYKALRDEKKKVDEGIKKAHGLIADDNDDGSNKTKTKMKTETKTETEMKTEMKTDEPET